jgi:multidrug efflux pump
MMCAYISTSIDEGHENRLMRGARHVFDGMHRFYAATLGSALRHPLVTVAILLATIVLNFYLYGAVSKGFFPQEDSGILFGNIQADQAISFQAMERKFEKFVQIIHADPAVQNVVGFTGGGGGGPRGGGATNSGQVFVQLKPLAKRKLTTDQIIARLGPRLRAVAGARLFLQGRQDVRAGGRQGNAQFQYTVEGDTLEDITNWVPKITNALQDVDQLEDVNSDKQDKGLEVDLTIDRATAARLGVNPTQIDNTLYDAFGQRQVSTIYNELNQYHVVMEVAPAFWQSPETLNDIYISTSGGALSGTQSSGAVAGTTVLASGLQPTAAAVASDAARNQQLNAIANTARGNVSTGAAISSAQETMVPLSAIASFGPGTTPLSINHQGPFVATTFSFNLPTGGSLGAATNAINQTMTRLGVPASVHGEFAGTAQLFVQSLTSIPLLILAAIVTVYIVLGILYESFVHPLTILSTLPSAGVGALLAILYLRADFSLVSMIAVILLIGIVKKNAIMMIDFAIQVQRVGNLSPRDAISQAALLRFRPIMMTTFAALLGSLPLAISSGEGAELRKPLGVAIVGGLIVSQILTLYTTPVVYLYLERFRLRAKRGWDRSYARLVGDPPAAPAE